MPLGDLGRERHQGLRRKVKSIENEIEGLRKLEPGRINKDTNLKSRSPALTLRLLKSRSPALTLRLLK